MKPKSELHLLISQEMIGDKLRAIGKQLNLDKLGKEMTLIMVI